MQDENSGILTEKINDFIKLMNAKNYCIIDIKYQMVSFVDSSYVRENHSALIMYVKTESLDASRIR